MSNWLDVYDCILLLFKLTQMQPNFSCELTFGHCSCLHALIYEE